MFVSWLSAFQLLMLAARRVVGLAAFYLFDPKIA
jgi:hypothetical protein